jgi:predicted helicase
MKDTSRQITDMQRKLIHSKTEEERSLMGAEMIDSVYEMVKKQIMKEEPRLSKQEVQAKLFLRFYKNDFSEQQKEKIVATIKNAR